MTGLPGWLAVQLRAAVSVTGLPSSTGPAPAAVASVGVTGLTVKHSLGLVAPLSVASPSPDVPDVKVPRQQYRPTEVTVAAAERTGMVVELLTGPELIEVPPLTQLSVSLGPHRKKDSVPFQVEMPLTVRLAESLTETEPVPIERPPAGIVPPLPSLAVVTRPDSHLPKELTTKSLSVAVVEVEERVSATMLEKHSPARPRVDRLMPAS